ncbi:MAG: alpha/beta fold hydrolase [Armatimonadetes bacterium]|nr:alpha/beta fold hydrolase [Armatimonadota bacterium]
MEHFIFENDGARLVAALHRPRVPSAAGIVFLHGWPGYRVGTHRMILCAAREAAARGMFALRFDFRGRGDSDGPTHEVNLVTMISDARRAAEELIARTGVRRIAFVGDCSGCEVAIGAAPAVPQLVATALWSAPIIGGQRQAAEAAKRRAIWAAYARKLFSAQSWGKLLRGAVRWDMIWRAIARGGKGKGEEGTEADRQVDWIGSFSSFRGERLFIYGSADPVTEACVSFYRNLCDRCGCRFNLYMVDGANHAFYSAAWHTEVISVTVDWLASRLIP